jgi:PTH1 family peptidyl-tRNA hydrolase
MRLICGLGNPGDQYSYSRHNIGYLVVDSLLCQFGLRLKAGRGDFLYARTTIPGDTKHQEAVLTRPTLHMNLSGVSVSQMMEQFDPDPEELLLVLDDVNLPFGKIRLRSKGSHGGHRGLESVIYQLETDQFARLRVGIGDAASPEVLKEYVLDSFDEQEKAELPQIVDRAREAVLVWSVESIERAMSKVNAMNA